MKVARICAVGLLLFSAYAVRADDLVRLQESACVGLRGLSIPASVMGLPTSGAAVTSAVMVPVSEKGNANGEYCKVIGIIKPFNAGSSEMEFEVNLPSVWNGRALQMGGGGFDGSLVTGLTGETMQPAQMDTPLKRGYVTLGGDGGHKSNIPFDAGWAKDEEALVNFGKQSVKKVHDAAVYIVRKAYGRAPSRFYFSGGSQGGHEALDAAARYPDDYDGVISHFPAYNVTMLHLGSLNVGKALYSNGGAGWISPAKIKLITNAVYAACDKLDGAQDGIVSNVKSCSSTFDVKKLRCPDGKDTGDTCLSDPQLDAVLRITSEYRPGVNIAGLETFPKWPLLDGAAFELSNFGDTSKPANPPTMKDSLLYFAGSQTVRNIITRNPNQDALAFDEKQWKERIAAVASIMDVTNISLDKFRAKGGKLILTHGTVDDFITPYNSEIYYKRQVQQFTQPVVDSFIRFYLIPGLGHGFGPFNAKFDSLQTLENWVEKGQAPGELMAVDGNPNTNRSRPLCVWPAWPKFTGKPGTEDKAESYTCVK